MVSFAGACVPASRVEDRRPLTVSTSPDAWTRPYRWSRRQSRRLSVYVSPPLPGTRVRCDSLVNRALDAWNTNGEVELTRIATAGNADIRIIWTNSLPKAHPGITLLRPNRRGELVGADVFVNAIVPAREAVSSDRVLYGVIAHEVGHALGLPHAYARDQIMNGVLHTLDITSADLAALRLLRRSAF